MRRRGRDQTADAAPRATERPKRWQEVNEEWATYFSSPAFARGLLLRLAAPAAFVGLVGLLAVTHAPQWFYLVALGVTLGVIATGAVLAHNDMSRTAPRQRISELLRRGGFRYVLFGVAAIVLLITTLR